MSILRPLVGSLYRMLRPLVFLQDAQYAHDQVLRMLSLMDRNEAIIDALQRLHRRTFDQHPANVGGVSLAHPYMLAAGFIKGHGFETESAALQAVYSGENIIPGWRSVPALLGACEFGSYTRHPRIGNAGTVIWRHAKTRSTQNRVGLKNPGAVAAAAFLCRHAQALPPIYGINIAVSPGVDGPDALTDIHEAFEAFLASGLRPNWFTLNISCPNTEDDPTGNQTAQQAYEWCSTARKAIERHTATIPLWVKVGPDLAPVQYAQLIEAFLDSGVQGIIATNTHGAPAPDHSGQTAGVGGGALHPDSLRAIDYLQSTQGHSIDIIGCGGLLDGASAHDFHQRGVRAIQYYSALIYRGPLAAAHIDREYRA